VKVSAQSKTHNVREDHYTEATYNKSGSSSRSYTASSKSQTVSSNTTGNNSRLKSNSFSKIGLFAGGETYSGDIDNGDNKTDSSTSSSSGSSHSRTGALPPINKTLTKTEEWGQTVDCGTSSNSSTYSRSSTRAYGTTGDSGSTTNSGSTTSQSTRSSTGSIVDTTQSQQIGSTRQTTAYDYSYYCSTTSTSTTEKVTTGTGGTQSTSTWTWDEYTRSDTHQITDVGETQSVSSQTLSQETGTVASATAQKYSLKRLYNSTVYLSSQENAWTLKPLGATFAGSSTYRITDLYGKVSATSFELQDVVPSVSVSTVYNTYMSVYSSLGFDTTLTTGNGTNTGTVESTSYNWTKWIDGNVWETGGSGVQGSSRIQEVETSKKDYNPAFPSYTDQSGTGTNTYSVTLVDLATHLLSSDKETYQTTSKVNVAENTLSSTYYTWHGSRTTTALVNATMISTSTGKLASYAITGSSSNFMGYRSVTNEYTFAEQSVVTSTAWDEDWAKSRQSFLHTADTSYSGTYSRIMGINAYTSYLTQERYEVYANEENTGADSVIEISEVAHQYAQTAWMGSPVLTVITPVNASGYLGFGGNTSLHDNAQYGWVNVSIAGDTFASWQEFKTRDLKRSRIGVSGGNLILTDKCNMPFGYGTYAWSSSSALFSTASTLLATYSSTTQSTMSKVSTTTASQSTYYSTTQTTVGTGRSSSIASTLQSTYYSTTQTTLATTTASTFQSTYSSSWSATVGTVTTTMDFKLTATYSSSAQTTVNTVNPTTSSTMLVTYSSSTQTTVGTVDTTMSSALPGTASSTTQTTVDTTTATFKQATYTLNLAHLVTGDFIDYQIWHGGGGMGAGGLMTTYSYSFEKEDSLGRDRTVLFPEGVYSITTNQDGSQVGSGTYLFTASENSTVMPNGDEFYIEQELLVSALAGYGKGVGYTVK